jgi:YegS/Rv2252/BmrU family lipid kinase
MKTEKIFILANMNARGKNQAALNSAIEGIKNKVCVKIIFTTSAEDAKEQTRKLSQNPNHVIAACGGDGTVNSIIQGLADQSRLGIIPSGTANVIARELGIPLNFKQAVHNLVTGRAQKVDVGLCNGRRFLFVAGIGFDAQVAMNVPGTLKKILGKYAYHFTSLKELITYKAPELTVNFNDDRKSITGQFAIIANMRRYGGDLFFAPEARHDDGRLNLILLKKFRASSVLRLFNFARKTAPFPEKDAIKLEAESFTINSSFKAPYELDGEAFTPIKTYYFSAKKQKINVVVP